MSNSELRVSVFLDIDPNRFIHSFIQSLTLVLLTSCATFRVSPEMLLSLSLLAVVSDKEEDDAASTVVAFVVVALIMVRAEKDRNAVVALRMFIIIIIMMTVSVPIAFGLSCLVRFGFGPEFLLCVCYL